MARQLLENTQSFRHLFDHGLPFKELITGQNKIITRKIKTQGIGLGLTIPVHIGDQYIVFIVFFCSFFVCFQEAGVTIE